MNLRILKYMICRCFRTDKRYITKMSTDNSRRLLARYEATVATGLEEIAREEIKEKLDARTEISKGRVILETEEPVAKILRLKTINNVFVVIHDEHIPEEDMPEDCEQLERLLSRAADKCDWLTGLTKWVESCKFTRCNMDQLMTKDHDLRRIQPVFRASSNRSGAKHKFTSQDICVRTGNVLDTKFGWPIKMKNYDLEVFSNLNENHLYMTITLTPISLACRNVIAPGFTTLKAATCYAMLRVAKVETGDIVLDPMAGSGAIPVENMTAWVDAEWFAYSIASDLSRGIVAKSQLNMNVHHLIGGDKLSPPSDLLMYDTTIGVLKDNSIDVIVSDLPFGRRHGSKAGNRSLYPRMMKDLSRITRLGTGRAVLLTQDWKSMSMAHEATKEYWIQNNRHHVKVGDLNCWIYLFHRTSALYQ